LFEKVSKKYETKILPNLNKYPNWKPHNKVHASKWRLPDQTVFVKQIIRNKNGLSYRCISKNLLTSILTLSDMAKIPPKIIFSKDGY
jgi:hypothetical protein